MKKPETELALLLQRRGIVTNLYALKPQQEKITLKLGVEEALCQTMEECSELVAACNQYRRAALMKGQPTSESYGDVTANLKEELVDTIICIKELIMILGIDYSDLERIEQEKIERTVRRLGFHNPKEYHCMPLSRLDAEQPVIKDGRIKRHGGS